MKKVNSTESFIKKANEIHNYKYDYSKVDYVGSKIKVCIICPEHGEWMQTPNNHLTGFGHPKCGRLTTKNKLATTTEQFILKAKLIHGDEYDYSKVEYINKTTNVIIICKEHGEFLQKPDSHINLKSGCPICARIKSKNKLLKSTEEFILDANKIHNNHYDYSETEYQGAYIPVTIICPKHGKFRLTPHAHLSSKSGCPYCFLKSLKQLYDKLCDTFQEETIIFEASKKYVDWLENLRFDIYFPKYNIAVEYNGKQHYTPVERFGGKLGFEQAIKRDILKRQKCKEHNCSLFEMKYDYNDEDYNNLIINIKNIIKNYESNS